MAKTIVLYVNIG